MPRILFIRIRLHCWLLQKTGLSELGVTGNPYSNQTMNVCSTYMGGRTKLVVVLPRRLSLPVFKCFSSNSFKRVCVDIVCLLKRSFSAFCHWTHQSPQASTMFLSRVNSVLYGICTRYTVKNMVNFITITIFYLRKRVF